MSDLPPFLYRTYRQNLHRTTTKTRKERELHKLERALYFWPMWAWVYMRGRRLKPEQTIKTPSGVFFNARKQEGRLMAVDITNHLIPYTQVKRMLANAWDQGHEAGWSDAHAWLDVTEGHVEFDEYEDTPNPYQDET